MNKTVKKILIAIVLFAAVVLMKNTNSFAATNTKDKAFKAFSNMKDNTTYTLYVGQRMGATGDYYTSWYFTPEITIKDLKVASVQYKTEIKANKVGTTNVTVKITYNEKTVTKTYKVNVIQTKENTKLESKINDVVSITPNSQSKNEVLLANSELWKTNNKTYKLTKKDTGNVAKYVYSQVYKAGNKPELMNITSTLKKDGTLKVENAKESISAKKVKEVSDYGYLTQDGRFYMYTLKNNKLLAEKKANKVTTLVGNYLYVKNGKTYATSGEKIFNFAIKDADGYSTGYSGLALNKKGKLYTYRFDYTTKKYTTEQVASNVKALVGTNRLYVTKSGKIEKYTTSKYETVKDVIKSVYILGNTLTLKTNNKLYLNDVKILTNVEDVTYANGSKNKSALIVRKDGSIWRLDLSEKPILTKIRSGAKDAKRISKPTDVKATKSGKTNVKIKWSKVEGATGYTVYRSTSKDGKYKKIGTTTSKSFKDTTAKKGKTYYYKVVANYEISTYNSEKSKAAKIKL